MRSILERTDLYYPRIKVGYRKQVAFLTITANQTLTADHPPVMAFDATSTNRTITMEAATAANEGLEREIINASSGTAVLTINNSAATAIGSIGPGGRALVKIINGVMTCWVQSFSNNTQNNASKLTLLMPIPLWAGLANSQVYKLPVAFPFTLTAIRARAGVPVTTASKAATVTAQINGVAVTGGVVSMTSAGLGTTGVSQAGTAITAGNTGTAAQTIEAAISSVTAFVEGGGWFEFDVTNTG